MPEFLTTHKTASGIEDIIRKAQHQLTLVSPYLKISTIFFDRLKDADARGVAITIIFGKDQLTPEQRNQLSTLGRLSLLFCENLHAKCYFNESLMVITSMNMYEFSEKNNREMGVLLTVLNDSVVFNEARQEVESIKRASVKQALVINQFVPKPAIEAREKSPPNTRAAEKAGGFIASGIKGLFNSLFDSHGYCIRCGENIPIDPERPFCESCYSSWSKFKNPNYQEEVCHACGKKAKTNKLKPLCRTCYEKS